MRERKYPIGDKNIVGERIREKRESMGLKQKNFLTQLQVSGLDLNSSGLSKIEGQTRAVNDSELIVIAKVLGVTVHWLLGISED